MIFWLLSYWFNCLFPPEHCLFIALWRASDCSHCMHANLTRHEPQLPLSLNTSLISLCLKSGTTQSWQVGKIPPSITLLNIFCVHTVYWPAEGCDGSVPIYAKKPSLLADDCQLNHSIWLHPWGQLEPLGNCTCKDFKVVILHLNWGNVYLNESLEKWKCVTRKTTYIA